MQASRSAIGRRAGVFAALGDEVRLGIVGKLSGGARWSVSGLTRGSGVTRQAVRKHLRVLERAGVVRGVRRGRESLFELEKARLEEAREELARISREWDVALGRLKAMAEKAAETNHK